MISMEALLASGLGVVTAAGVYLLLRGRTDYLTDRYSERNERAMKAIDAAIKALAAIYRTGERFGTGHLLFTRLDDTYEKALDAATDSELVRIPPGVGGFVRVTMRSFAAERISNEVANAFFMAMVSVCNCRGNAACNAVFR